jgi:thioredoxin 2
MIVSCPNCGVQNKLPENVNGKKVVCGRCKMPLDGKPVPVTDASFSASIAKGPSVVDFWAPWCGPCRMIGPVLDELAGQRRHIRFAKLNVDENPVTAAQVGARSIPLLVFYRDGVEQGRVVGAVPKGQIEAAIAEYLQ